jgi:hypothetical protein
MSRDPYYNTRAWRRLREQCLSASPLCVTCGAPAVVADHIIPRSAGGADSLENLRSLCLHHHAQRRHGGEPILKGCNAAGTPTDPRHWWNDAPKNLSGLRRADRRPEPEKVMPTRFAGLA